MMGLRNFIRLRLCPSFLAKEEGAVLAEALLAVPFATLFVAGILEFGNIFWERMQIDAGLRDAGRYLSRCRHTATFNSDCSVETAKRIAFYGTQSLGTTPPRVPGWGSSLADITVPVDADGNVVIDADGNFTVSTTHQYEASPLFGWLGIDAITISASHEERYIGW
ncbi:pilus assembly protein [Ensifer sp. IC4062]|nr:pilus assembly protein [Ensifer sp. IC4062]